MDHNSFWRRLVLVSIILYNRSQVLKGQTLNNTTEGSLSVTPSPSAKERGINLGNSFFLQKLRQGNVGAINDFNSLRQTLTIPENQQKHFTNFLQQQNPFYRFALWHVMQNALMHGFPNSHAINRMDFLNSQPLALQQYLHSLHNGGTFQGNAVSTPTTVNKRINSASGLSDSTLAGSRRLSVTTNPPFISLQNFQKDHIPSHTNTNAQNGLLGTDRIKDEMRAKLNTNSLHVQDKEEKSRTLTSKQIKKVDESSKESTRPDNLPQGFILQFVGDVFSPNHMRTAHKTSGRTKLIQNEITNQISTNQVQKNIQFVGNIFGNRRSVTVSKLSTVPATESALERNNGIQPNDTNQILEIGGLTSSVKHTKNDIQPNREETSKKLVRDIFLRLVGDVTGAEFVGANNDIDELSGKTNTNITELFKKASSAGVQKQFNMAPPNLNFEEKATLLADSGSQAKNGIASFVNRDFYLRKVGNLIADQLTPVDGGLIAFNKTNRGVFTGADVQNKTTAPLPRMVVQPNVIAWPLGRGNIMMGLPRNVMGRGSDTFKNMLNSNPVHIFDRQQFQTADIPQHIPQAKSRISQNWRWPQQLQIINNELRQSGRTNSTSRGGDNNTNRNNSEGPNILKIVDLLRALTNKTSNDGEDHTGRMITRDRQSLRSQKTVPSTNISAINVHLNGLRNSFIHRMVERERGTRNTAMKSPNSLTGTQLRGISSFPNNIEMNNLLNPGSNMQNENVMVQTGGEVRREFGINQMKPTVTQLQSIKNLQKINLQNNVQQPEAGNTVRLNPVQDPIFRDKQIGIARGMKVNATNQQHIGVQLEGPIKTFTDLTENKAAPSTGIETGFILVNRLFVTDDVRNNLGRVNKSGQSRSGIKTIFTRKETDPRTGEIVDMVVGVIPSRELTRKETVTSQHVTPEC